MIPDSIRNEEMRLSAYHEAGHAVLAWQYGMLVGIVEIGDEPATRMALPDPKYGAEKVIPAMVALCAGPIAERIHGRGESNGTFRDDLLENFTAEHDLESIRALARGLTPNRAEQDSVIRVCYRMACQQVSREGANIRRLAKHLLKANKLGAGHIDAEVTCARILKVRRHGHKLNIRCRRVTRAEFERQVYGG